MSHHSYALRFCSAGSTCCLLVHNIINALAAMDAGYAEASRRKTLEQRREITLAGGRALFDLCATRPEPVPFFGELGSVNPMFLLPHAVAARGAEIAAGWAGSLTLGVGQFCTKPGIAVVVRGSHADAFAAAAVAALSETDRQVMLTDAIAQGYRAGRDRVAGSAGVEAMLSSPCADRFAAPSLTLLLRQPTPLR